MSEPENPWLQSGDLFCDRRLQEAGLTHGVTTRVLGDMAEPAARHRAMERAGLSGRIPRLLKQVHDTGIQIQVPQDVAEIPEGDGWLLAGPGSPGAKAAPEGAGDGSLPRPVVGVYVADCAPLFLWSSSRRAAGVFHVGWRGARHRMPSRAVESFHETLGVPPGELSASIGPRIGPCCFRVGPEVSSLFRAGSSLDKEDGHYLDLGAEISAQLQEEGVPAAAIAASGECTFCRSELFFSYRREKQSLRMLAFLSLN